MDKTQGEKDKLRMRRWVAKNRKRYNEYQRKWRKKNPEKVKAAKVKYRGRNPERVKERQALYRKKRRMTALEYYGGKPPRCACCDERLIEFLCLDHKHGGGNKHRKSLGDPAGTIIYQWVKNKGYPEGFRVLCYNCNNSFGHYGYCPHRKE